MVNLHDRLEPGSPYPLGATWDGLGVNFAVFSANATRMTLCIFDPKGHREVARLDLPECTDEVWHGYLPDAHPGLVYGFRADGPYAPTHGHRFNYNKLLLDPYARQLLGAPRWSDSLFGYRLNSARADLSFDRRDSAPAMAKAVVVPPIEDSQVMRPRPHVPWPKTIIYEAHVKGLTARRDDMLPPDRGSFTALADDRTLDHLHRLGITTLELMPVQGFVNDRFLLDRGLKNYWGYNTLSFFAPHPAYMPSDSIDEVRDAIRKIRASGIEVLLDVVYNHSCEGNQLGPTFSFRGLDNASYYRLVPGDERHYINDTGCGNTLNLSHPRVLQMVMDSLRYWMTDYGVDGFRFDLATILGREGPGYDPGSGFLDAVAQDPVLARAKLVAEPWDPGPGGYQLGAFPAGWAEWNDKFRDCVRRFWRGDPGQRAELAGRLAGSADLFDRHRRKPWASVNFVTCHDGFTLEDTVSYEAKHNEPNREDNQDGAAANWSSNGGIEGPSDDADVVQERGRAKRAMLATLILSQGTPMLLAGDEFGRSQQGNNNAYCQDNETSWIDWTQAHSPEGERLTDYVARLIALRKRFPVLEPSHFMHGKDVIQDSLAEIAWFDAEGCALTPEEWNEPEGRTLTLRLADANKRSTIDCLLMLLNGGAEPVTFTLPEPACAWCLLIDSAAPERGEEAVGGNTIEVPARAFLLVHGEIDPAL